MYILVLDMGLNIDILYTLPCYNSSASALGRLPVHSSLRITVPRLREIMSDRPRANVFKA